MSQKRPASRTERLFAWLVDRAYVPFVVLLASLWLDSLAGRVREWGALPGELAPGSPGRTALGIALRVAVPLATFTAGRMLAGANGSLGRALVGLELESARGRVGFRGLALDLAFHAPAALLLGAVALVLATADPQRISGARLETLAMTCRILLLAYCAQFTIDGTCVVLAPGRRTPSELSFGVRTSHIGIRSNTLHRAAVERTVAAWAFASVADECRWLWALALWSRDPYSLNGVLPTVSSDAFMAILGWMHWVGYGAALLGVARFSVATGPRGATRSLLREFFVFTIPVVNLWTFHRRVRALRDVDRRALGFVVPYGIGMLALASTVAPLAYLVFVIASWSHEFPRLLAFTDDHMQAIMRTHVVASILFLALGARLARVEPRLSADLAPVFE